jgi:subtilase family serine protease
MSQMFLLSILTLCATTCCLAEVGLQKTDQAHARPLDTHVFKESIMLLSSRTDLINKVPIPGSYVHDLIFTVQQKNLDELERALYDVSEPSSPNYGRHWSGEQIRALTENPKARNAIVSYLHANGANVISESLGGDFITANATLSVWSKMLNTEFFMFHQRQHNGDIHQYARAHEYSVPKELDDHIHHVLNVIELPVISVTAPTRLPENAAEERNSKFEESEVKLNGWLLPANLREFYNLENSYGSSQSTQSACGFNQDYFSPNSLSAFQTLTNQPQQPANLIGGFVSEQPGLDYAESNLDIEFIMGMSQRSPTTYWHSPYGIFTWLVEISNAVNPPLVLSISYGADESTTSKSTHDSCTTLAMKLGLRGVSIFAASGDDGAHSYKANGSPDKCGYDVLFPAGNPYFTAVGATAVSKLHQLLPTS